jgi:hypothetical protein
MCYARPHVQLAFQTCRSRLRFRRFRRGRNPELFAARASERDVAFEGASSRHRGAGQLAGRALALGTPSPSIHGRDRRGSGSDRGARFEAQRRTTRRADSVRAWPSGQRASAGSQRRTHHEEASVQRSKARNHLFRQITLRGYRPERVSGNRGARFARHIADGSPRLRRKPRWVGSRS